MPFNLGGPELMVILVIVLIVFGAGKLPNVMRDLGTGVREFKKAQQEDDSSPVAPVPPATSATPASPATNGAASRPATTPRAATAPTTTSPGEPSRHVVEPSTKY